MGTLSFEEKVAFFVNVYHVLLLHATMYYTRGAKDSLKQVRLAVQRRTCVCAA